MQVIQFESSEELEVFLSKLSRTHDEGTQCDCIVCEMRRGKAKAKEPTLSDGEAKALLDFETAFKDVATKYASGVTNERDFKQMAIGAMYIMFDEIGKVSKGQGTLDGTLEKEYGDG